MAAGDGEQEQRLWCLGDSLRQLLQKRNRLVFERGGTNGNRASGHDIVDQLVHQDQRRSTPKQVAQHIRARCQPRFVGAPHQFVILTLVPHGTTELVSDLSPQRMDLRAIRLHNGIDGGQIRADDGCDAGLRNVAQPKLC